MTAFIVGSTGTDHSGPDYSDRDYTVVSIQGDSVVVSYNDNQEQRTYSLKAKQTVNDRIVSERNARAIIAAKKPGFLSSDKISWTPNMGWFLGWLAAFGRLYVETIASQADRFVDQYEKLTGVELQEKKGLFSVLVPNPDLSDPNGRWTTKCEIIFPPTANLPDSLAVLQQYDGKISRCQIFWALVEHGFRVAESQDIAKIRQFVPSQFTAEFDAGVLGVAAPPRP